MPETITLADLAAICGLDEQALTRLSAKGILPKFHKSGAARDEAIKAAFAHLRERLDAARRQEHSWTINGLFQRTGIDRRTWQTWLHGIKPNRVDGEERYDLRMVVEAVKADEAEESQDLEREQARLTAAKADLAEMERAQRRKELLDVETVFRVWENVCLSIRRAIVTSGLPERDVDAILSELKKATKEAMVEQEKFTKSAEEE